MAKYEKIFVVKWRLGFLFAKSEMQNKPFVTYTERNIVYRKVNVTVVGCSMRTPLMLNFMGEFFYFVFLFFFFFLLHCYVLIYTRTI